MRTITREWRGIRWEIGVDFHQWSIGFNAYGRADFGNGWMANVFIGPIRLGAWTWE